jgi:hypothetical protein
MEAIDMLDFKHVIEEFEAKKEELYLAENKRESELLAEARNKNSEKKVLKV